MKIVKALLVLILVLAAVLVLGGFLLSPKFSVARSVSIAAPPDKVYALVVDPRRWKEWTVWNQRDPQMQMTYGGPPSGAGASWSWQSKTEGDGRMTFTAAAAPTLIERVEPYCATDTVAVQTDRAASERPVPSCPNSSTHSRGRPASSRLSCTSWLASTCCR